ncbi:MAG: 2-oxo acid dehydrogenase subunit E2 [Gemmatimonadota bacterium]|nr:MAG: 2-oxo acid dehydrogenase subunit E2 [Gemmatimonadota bacterium]
MATRIVMSKLSPTMEEGRVLQWLKSEGDTVETGDVLLEVETDTANMEVEAMGSGVLRKILVGDEVTVPTGTLLGVIAAEDEDISDLLSASDSTSRRAAADGDGTDPEPPSVATIPEPQPAVPSPSQRTPRADQASESPAAQDGGRLKASPLARRMASDRGVELARVQGTGPGGRIIKRDIEAATAIGPSAASAPYDIVALTQTRKAIARNLVQSLGPVPHFYLTTEIDMGRATELRQELNQSLADSGLKVGINDILIKAAAQALLEHPDVNVAFLGDHIRRFKRVDVGIAVAIADGLITPVLRNAGAKGLRQISLEAAELIGRAREKRLTPEEYQGATFTISNLGMFGIDEFTAVINPPAATILAVGAIKEKPVVTEGTVQVRSRMRVTLSCDHRAVDGAMGAEFLATFREMLENPLRLIL